MVSGRPSGWMMVAGTELAFAASACMKAKQSVNSSSIRFVISLISLVLSCFIILNCVCKGTTFVRNHKGFRAFSCISNHCDYSIGSWKHISGASFCEINCRFLCHKLVSNYFLLTGRGVESALIFYKCFVRSMIIPTFADGSGHRFRRWTLPDVS